jgi:hypothetical protein
MNMESCAYSFIGLEGRYLLRMSKVGMVNAYWDSLEELNRTVALEHL